MAKLLLLRGPDAGTEFALDRGLTVLGRQPDVDLCLDSAQVSRKHAVITCDDDRFFLEDLDSSNGTFLNSVPVQGKTELFDQDQIRIGDSLLVFEKPADEPADVHIHAQLAADTSNLDLFKRDTDSKLRAVLEIAEQQARTFELDELFPKILDQLLGLFRQADRGLLLLREDDQLVVRALRVRRPGRAAGQAYSRSVVERVLAEGVGIVAAGGGAADAQTLVALGIRSYLCVPLKARDGRPVGVLQLDSFGHGSPFTPDDLYLLTTVSLQLSVVIENGALHAAMLEHEKVKRDLALARLRRMVAGVAHEINNPLAFVSNNNAVLARDFAAVRRLVEMYQLADDTLAQHRPELLQQICTLRDEIDLPYTLKSLDDLLTRSREGLKRIGQIVSGLRDFARLDESERAEVDLNTGIEVTLSLMGEMAAKQHVEMVADLAPLPRLDCEPAKINQVVFNLLSNALDACPHGGKVTVRTTADADAVEIHVLDTGPGIDPAVRDKIFDPFFTTKPLGKGVGMGLSTSYGIVQDHGGRIEVESTPGKGAHFTVRLPLCRGEG